MTPKSIPGSNESLLLTRTRSGIVMLLGVVTPEQEHDNALFGDDAVLQIVVLVNRVAKAGKRLFQYSCN